MKQAAIAFDQFLNAVAGGWADETFSARCWREGKTHKGWDTARIAVDTLFFWQPQHCFESYLSEYERKQLPEEYRYFGFAQHK